MVYKFNYNTVLSFNNTDINLLKLKLVLSFAHGLMNVFNMVFRELE